MQHRSIERYTLETRVAHTNRSSITCQVFIVAVRVVYAYTPIYTSQHRGRLACDN